MTDAALIHVIVALRVGVAVSWSIIGAVGARAMGRIILGNSGKGDIGWASLFLIAVGLLIFQWRSLAGLAPVIADAFVAIALLSFLLSAIGIFYARAMKAPVEHQRAALISHCAVVAACMVAGALS